MSLIQARKDSRERFIKAISRIIGLPVILIGLLILYYGYSEVNYLLLFFYFIIDLTIVIMGLKLIWPDMLRQGKAMYIRTEPAKQKGKTMKKGKTMHCTNCGAPIVTAGKFCGNCGEPIDLQKV
jgi:uncharacterized membrane protein